jgi:hypothetical protein
LTDVESIVPRWNFSRRWVGFAVPGQFPDAEEIVRRKRSTVSGEDVRQVAVLAHNAKDIGAD